MSAGEPEVEAEVEAAEAMDISSIMLTWQILHGRLAAMSGPNLEQPVALLSTHSVPGSLAEAVEEDKAEEETVEVTAVVVSVQSRPLLLHRRKTRVSAGHRMGLILDEEPISSLDSYPIGTHPMDPRSELLSQAFARLLVLPEDLFAAWSWSIMLHGQATQHEMNGTLMPTLVVPDQIGDFWNIQGRRVMSHLSHRNIRPCRLQLVVV